MSIEIYGHWLSEPSRSVAWLCMNEGIEFSFEEIDLHSGQHLQEGFREKSPTGLIPAIFDPRHGIRMSEGAAILQYLCERENLISWYPPHPKIRATLLQYLHWHHTNTRKLSYPLFATFMKEKDPHAKAVLRDANAMGPCLTLLNEWIPEGKFLCGTDQPTIADLLYYPEFDQTVVFDLMDLTPYPRIVQWMKKMEQVPHHHAIQKGLRRYQNQLSPVE